MKSFKNFLFLFSLTGIFFSCSPESSEDAPEEKMFQVNFSGSNFQLGVDEMAVLSIDSEKPLTEMRHILEAGHRSLLPGYPGGSLPSDQKLYFKFADPGTKHIELEFTSTDGITVAKELKFEVSRGNTVQITGIKVNSFYNFDGSWDPEYPDDNEERLADVVFVLEKLKHNNFVSDRHFMGRWYTSEVRENQKNLTWDLSEEELYVDSKHLISIGLADQDNGQLSEDLLRLPVLKDLRLMAYESTRPEQINLIDEELELDVTFFLDWP